MSEPIPKTSGSPLRTFFAREVSQFWRARGSVWMRLTLPAFSMVALLWMLGLEPLPQPSGQTAFATLMLLNAYFVFGQTSYFCRAITSEREQGTLDALRITGLTPFALLLGKGTSQCVRATLLLATQLPVTALCVVQGGVTMGQLLSCYALIITLLFFGCHVGLFASVISKTSRSAAQGTMVILLLLYALPWYTSAFFGKIASVPRPLLVASEFLVSVNPLSAYRLTTSTGSFPWLCLAFHLLAGLGFLGLALLFFERGTRLTATTGAEVPRAARGHRPRRGPLPRVGPRALLWKEFHFAAGGPLWVRWRWFIYPVAAILALLAMHAPALRRSFQWEHLSHALLLTGLIGLGLEFVFIAVRMFGGEVLNQTLGDVLLLPLRTRRIVWEKFLGYVPNLLPPLTCFVLGAALASPRAWAGLLEDIGLGLALYILLQIALLLIYTVHFSLHGSRSALALAFTLSWVSNSLLFIVTRLALDLRLDTSLLLLGVASLWLLVYLIRLLPYHLAVVAAK